MSSLERLGRARFYVLVFGRDSFCRYFLSSDRINETRRRTTIRPQVRIRITQNLHKPEVLLGEKIVDHKIRAPSAGSGIRYIQTVAECDSDFFVVNGKHPLSEIVVKQITQRSQHKLLILSWRNFLYCLLKPVFGV